MGPARTGVMRAGAGGIRWGVEDEQASGGVETGSAVEVADGHGGVGAEAEQVAGEGADPGLGTGVPPARGA
jgi:hypothetical protein